MSMRKLPRQFIPLEICVEGEDGAHAALRGGAGRLELCSALDVGGLTPSYGLMQGLRSLAIPVVALMRPRAGDFCYSAGEKAMIAHDIRAAAACGLDGVVLGAMSPSDALDESFLADMIALARSVFPSGDPLLTLHRVVDVLPDPAAAVAIAARLGFQRILTSGGGAAAMEGRNVLRRMVASAAGRVSIMAGGGVRPDNVSTLVSDAGVDEVHASARYKVQPNEALKKLGFVPGNPMQTSERLVRELRDRLI